MTRGSPHGTPDPEIGTCDGGRNQRNVRRPGQAVKFLWFHAPAPTPLDGPVTARPASGVPGSRLSSHVTAGTATFALKIAAEPGCRTYHAWSFVVLVD